MVPAVNGWVVALSGEPLESLAERVTFSATLVFINNSW
jgi:hypothetical protein